MVKLSPCLTKYHTMKTCSVLNYVSCHEDVMDKWRYSSTYS